MTTIELNPRLGAPFTAKSGQANPDDLLRRIMEETPGATEAETWAAFRDEILRDDDMVLACLRWYHVWARRRLENLTRSERAETTTPTPALRVSLEDRHKKTKAAVEKTKKTILLDWIMPNGKLLRDCTFAYVGTVGRQFAKIAAAGRPNEIVGEVLSNRQVQALIKK